MKLNVMKEVLQQLPVLSQWPDSDQNNIIIYLCVFVTLIQVIPFNL